MTILRTGFRLLTVLGLALTAGGQTGPSLVGQVNQRYGAQGMGNCVIGPQVPNGSINPSPNTPRGSTMGYQPNQPIRGFAQLHVSGTGGGGKYGQFLISPQTGLAVGADEHDSPKAEELPTPSYYSVILQRYGIRVEFTPTHHAAIYRFTFPESDQAHILIDLGHSVPGDVTRIGGWPTRSQVSVAPDGTISGWGNYYGGWHSAPFNVYFFARLSAAPAAIGTWNGDAIHQGSLEQSGGEKERIGAFARYATQAGQVVYLKIAVSFHSIERAKSHLESEIPAWDFDAVRQGADDAWNRTLESIVIEGGDAGRHRLFYSALHRSFQMPRDRTNDSPLTRPPTPYWDDHYCTWDTWRTLLPLYALIRPDIAAANINSFIERFERTGQCGGIFIAGNDGGGRGYDMGGHGPTFIIADAFVKGVGGVDWNKAYALVKHYADIRTPSYLELGWIPDDAGGENEVRVNRVSHTLEFSYNDYCAALMARKLGTPEDAARYLERSGKWVNNFNPDAESDGYKGFMQARRRDGAWNFTRGYWYGPRFDPAHTDGVAGPGFFEGNSWTYTLFVPHDFARLIALHGGAEAFCAKFDHGFRRQHVEQYNEPGFLAQRAFNYAGRPDLASQWTRFQLGRYALSHPPQDDDSGAMSSWFVWSAIGLFPNAGQDLYLLNAPLFEKTTIRLGSGRMLIIETPGASWDNMYIRAATLDGKPLDRAWLRHSEIANGAVLRFEVDKQARDWGKAQLPPRDLVVP